MIETAGQKHDIQPGSERSFGFVFAAAFGTLGIYGALNGHASGWVWLALAAVTLTVALVMPGRLAPLNRLWFSFGMLLARIMQPLVIGTVFFMVVTPIGLVMRALGKDMLRLRFEPAAPTYWIRRDPPGPRPRTMTQQF